MPRRTTSAKKESNLKKILVIDDDPTIIKLLESRLKANGYDVLAAEQAPVGLELAIREIPDLIILDVMMPIINGYNLCRLIKSQEKYRKIPVIMLTSRAEEEDKKIGKAVGADVYIVKPFKMEELLERIRELLST